MDESEISALLGIYEDDVPDTQEAHAHIAKFVNSRFRTIDQTRDHNIMLFYFPVLLDFSMFMSPQHLKANYYVAVVH